MDENIKLTYSNFQPSEECQAFLTNQLSDIQQRCPLNTYISLDLEKVDQLYNGRILIVSHSICISHEEIAKSDVGVALALLRIVVEHLVEWSQTKNVTKIHC